MSRIGRAPIELPNGVTLDKTTEGDVIVTGPKGTLRQNIASSAIIDGSGVVKIRY